MRTTTAHDERAAVFSQTRWELTTTEWEDDEPVFWPLGDYPSVDEAKQAAERLDRPGLVGFTITPGEWQPDVLDDDVTDVCWVDHDATGFYGQRPSPGEAIEWEPTQ